jgi:hypothetical protein
MLCSLRGRRKKHKFEDREATPALPPEIGAFHESNLRAPCPDYLNDGPNLEEENSSVHFPQSAL